MENTFETVAQNIKARRSTKPAVMNGKKIDDAIIQELLELANWAPTHAMTEPWRFIVYSGEEVLKYTTAQAELYKEITPEDKFVSSKYNGLIEVGTNLSHIIVAYMQRGMNPNIPELEEICSVSAAVQNILLGAEAAGIAVLWSTGGMTFNPALKTYLGLADSDLMIGQLYLGYSDSVKEGKRNTPIENKVKWVK